MSWEPSRRRWWKMYLGKRYVISCRQLDAPPTKEASYRAANSWWEQKQDQIDGNTEPDWSALRDPIRSTPEVRQQSLDWARRKALKGEGLWLALFEGRLREDREGMPIPYDEAIDGIVGPEPPDLSLGYWFDAWLALQATRAEARTISAAELANLKFYLAPFLEFQGRESPVTAITDASWEGYYRHLVTQSGIKDWSDTYRAKLLRYARKFVKYLATKKLEGRTLIETPTNLHADDIKFPVPDKVIVTFTIEEVHALYRRARGQLELHILLALNCGFTQQDIADLHPSEVNLVQGTITRMRSKLAHNARIDKSKVKRVCYKLWPETVRLLRKHRSSDPAHYLLTSTGGRWVDKTGKSKDMIRTNFSRLAKRLEISKSFRVFRATSASLLNGHPSHRSLTDVFLSRTPATITDGHYADYPQPLFDAAINWLRTQLGIDKL